MCTAGGKRVLQVPPLADAQGANQDSLPFQIKGDRLSGQTYAHIAAIICTTKDILAV